MKNFLNVLVISVLTISCQSNIAEKEIVNNNIIGTWEQVKEFEDNLEIEMNHCDFKNFIVFKIDKNIEYGIHDSNCDLDDETPYIGAWSDLNKNIEFTTDETFKVEFIDSNTIKVSEKEDLEGDFFVFVRI